MTNIDKVLKYTIFCGIAALLFTPFIVANSLFFPYITGKAYFFRIIVEIIFFLWLILAVLNKEYRPKKSLILYGLIVFLVSIFVSNYFGANQTASFWSNFERMEGYVTLAHLFCLFLVAGSVLKGERQWAWIFNISIFASFVLALLALKQLLGSDEISRVDLTLGNPIYLAVYMLFHIFLSLFYLSRINYKRWFYYLYWAVIFVNTFILFKTGTRGAVLGLVGGLSLTALVVIFTHWGNKKIRSFAIGGLLVIVAATASFWFAKDTSFVRNNYALNRIASISLSEGTAQARLINWQIAWSGFKERPILGWGQNNYDLAFDKYYLPEMHGNEAWFDRTHNIVLDWLIAGGVLGLVFYLFILLSLVYLIWNKTSTFSRLDKSILSGLLAAYFFHNLFVFDHLVSYIFFFLILAYVHSTNSSDVKLFQFNSPKIITGSLIGLAILAIPVSAYFINYPSYTANRELVSAMRLVKKVSSPAGETYTYYHAEGLNENLNLFKHAISRNTFGNPEIRQRMAMSIETILNIKDDSANQVKSDFIKETISELQAQISETPGDSKITYLLGTFYALTGDLENAEKELLETIRISPNKQAIRIPLIRVYLQSGQNDKALALAKETYNLDTSKDDLWFEYIRAAAVTDKELFGEIIDEAVEQGDTEKVISFLKYNIEKQPDNVQVLISLSAFYNRIGDKEKALLILDEALLKFPNYQYQLLEMRQNVEAGQI
ncbi:MAG TPA: O-antigen ligase family protein [Candidatus Paceibacterota bacterium]|nr:O-antigen ligase family protein [Candidatus Paceibacterota bacterium]HRZ34697.1 O-antigen ligase family protein [Candidatus Paceibacterota bacterium]